MITMINSWVQAQNNYTLSSGNLSTLGEVRTVIVFLAGEVRTYGMYLKQKKDIYIYIWTNSKLK